MFKKKQKEKTLHSMPSNIFFFVRLMFSVSPLLVLGELMRGLLMILPNNLIRVIGVKYIIDVVTEGGQILVDSMTRAAMIPYIVTQRIMSRRERIANQQAGIEQAKKEGKYAGRKPISVDENLLRQVAREFDEGIITIDEAMKRTKIHSRSTFYRKLRNL